MGHRKLAEGSGRIPTVGLGTGLHEDQPRVLDPAGIQWPEIEMQAPAPRPTEWSMAPSPASSTDTDDEVDMSSDSDDEWTASTLVSVLREGRVAFGSAEPATSDDEDDWRSHIRY